MHRRFLAFCALAFAAAPALAASYSARPATATAQRIIATDIVWNCGPTACAGNTEESRPAVLCQSLARRVGRLDSFAVDGRAFGAAELERCNAAARARPANALGAQ